MRDICCLCGAEAEALGPPPHVHLTCVLRVTPTKVGLFVSNSAHSVQYTTGEFTYVRRTKNFTTRQRLHPAVFEEAIPA